MQPKIDTQNRYRQDILGIEFRYPTSCWPFRLFTTVLGMTFGNAYTAFEYFVRPYNGSFLEFVNELCYDGMLNEIVAINAGAAPSAGMTPRGAFWYPLSRRPPAWRAIAIQDAH